MEWVFIMLCLLFGILLIVLEVIFIPGTTFVGIAGFLIGIYGIYLCYETYGSQAGIICAISSVTVSLLVITYSFRNKSWERFSLKSTMDNKVEKANIEKLQVGGRGKTISALRPVGNAEINGEIYEVRSENNFIASNTTIRILKIDHTKIFVEPII